MRIRVVSENAERFFQIQRFPLSIGREGNDLDVQDIHLSRKHAIFYLNERGELRIRDKLTTNGTFVNNERVTDAPVKVGDTISMGNVTLQLLNDAQAQVLNGWPYHYDCQPGGRRHLFSDYHD